MERKRRMTKMYVCKKKCVCVKGVDEKTEVLLWRKL